MVHLFPVSGSLPVSTTTLNNASKEIFISSWRLQTLMPPAAEAFLYPTSCSSWRAIPDPQLVCDPGVYRCFHHQGCNHLVLRFLCNPTIKVYAKNILIATIIVVFVFIYNSFTTLSRKCLIVMNVVGASFLKVVFIEWKATGVGILLKVSQIHRWNVLASQTWITTSD